MMPPRPSAAGQMDLLEWQPPAPVEAFASVAVRAATLTGRISRAVSQVLRDQARQGHHRETIATSMSAFLGEPVPKAMLDAYASEAREDHVISLVRFVALLHATHDKRPLQMIAAMFGWAVIDDKYLPMIELASVRERQDALRRHGDALRQQARAAGVL